MKARFERAPESVVTAPADASARALAERMRSAEVGSIVILDGENPVGIVTDRDLLARVVAERRDAAALSARDVMSAPLVTAPADDPLEKVVDRMAAHGIRRVPLLREGRVSGIVSLDDLVVRLSDELEALAHALVHQDQAARRRRHGHQRAALAAALGGHLASLARRLGRRLAPVRDWLRSDRG